MRILIVDDEFVSRIKMKKILSEFGECQAVSNGSDALEAYRNARKIKKAFDLITLDISMPDMDGTVVLDRIRKTEKVKKIDDHHKVKIIMVTSHAQKNIVVKSIKSGCDEYVVKPFKREQLVEKMEKLGLFEKTQNQDIPNYLEAVKADDITDADDFFNEAA